MTHRRTAADPHGQPIVATRVFKVGRRQVLRAILHLPIETGSAPPVWAAGFSVAGLAEPCTGRALGVDSLQALLHAAQAVRLLLEGVAPTFTWFGWEPGDTGIPRTIPVSYGLAFSKAMERLIEERTTEFVQQKLKVRRPQKRIVSAKRAAAAGTRTRKGRSRS